MSANIDDQSPETLAPIMTELMEKGALDAFFTPIQMKKGRPAYQLSVIVNPNEVEKKADLILRNTSTLGIRYQTMKRIIMKRSFRLVSTKFGPIHVKVAEFGDIKKQSPEFEDCQRAAKKNNVSLQEVYAAVYKTI